MDGRIDAQIEAQDTATEEAGFDPMAVQVAQAETTPTGTTEDQPLETASLGSPAFTPEALEALSGIGVTPESLVEQATEQGLIPPGADLDDPEVVAILQDLITQLTGITLEPAAPPGAPPATPTPIPGSGANFNPNDPGALPPGIGINALLPPTALQFGLITGALLPDEDAPEFAPLAGSDPGPDPEEFFVPDFVIYTNQSFSGSFSIFSSAFLEDVFGDVSRFVPFGAFVASDVFFFPGADPDNNGDLPFDYVVPPELTFEAIAAALAGGGFDALGPFSAFFDEGSDALTDAFPGTLQGELNAFAFDLDSLDVPDGFFDDLVGDGALSDFLEVFIEAIALPTGVMLLFDKTLFGEDGPISPKGFILGLNGAHDPISWTAQVPYQLESGGEVSNGAVAGIIALETGDLLVNDYAYVYSGDCVERYDDYTVRSNFYLFGGEGLPEGGEGGWVFNPLFGNELESGAFENGEVPVFPNGFGGFNLQGGFFDDWIVGSNGGGTVTTAGGVETEVTGNDVIHTGFNLAIPIPDLGFIFGALFGDGDLQASIEDLSFFNLTLSARDVVLAGDGNDFVYATGGVDQLYGEAGDDALRGGDYSNLFGGILELIDSIVGLNDETFDFFFVDSYYLDPYVISGDFSIYRGESENRDDSVSIDEFLRFAALGGDQQLNLSTDFGNDLVIGGNSFVADEILLAAQLDLLLSYLEGDFLADLVFASGGNYRLFGDMIELDFSFSGDVADDGRFQGIVIENGQINFGNDELRGGDHLGIVDLVFDGGEGGQNFSQAAFGGGFFGPEYRIVGDIDTLHYEYSGFDGGEGGPLNFAEEINFGDDVITAGDLNPVLSADLLSPYDEDGTYPFEVTGYGGLYSVFGDARIVHYDADLPGTEYAGILNFGDDTITTGNLGGSYGKYEVFGDVGELSIPAELGVIDTVDFGDDTITTGDIVGVHEGGEGAGYGGRYEVYGDYKCQSGGSSSEFTLGADTITTGSILASASGAVYLVFGEGAQDGDVEVPGVHVQDTFEHRGETFNDGPVDAETFINDFIVTGDVLGYDSRYEVHGNHGNDLIDAGDIGEEAYYSTYRVFGETEDAFLGFRISLDNIGNDVIFTGNAAAYYGQYDVSGDYWDFRISRNASTIELGDDRIEAGSALGDYAQYTITGDLYEFDVNNRRGLRLDFGDDAITAGDAAGDRSSMTIFGDVGDIFDVRNDRGRAPRIEFGDDDIEAGDASGRDAKMEIFGDARAIMNAGEESGPTLLIEFGDDEIEAGDASGRDAKMEIFGDTKLFSGGSSTELRFGADTIRAGNVTGMAAMIAIFGDFDQGQFPMFAEVGWNEQDVDVDVDGQTFAFTGINDYIVGGNISTGDGTGDIDDGRRTGDSNENSAFYKLYGQIGDDVLRTGDIEGVDDDTYVGNGNVYFTSGGAGNDHIFIGENLHDADGQTVLRHEVRGDEGGSETDVFTYTDADLVDGGSLGTLFIDFDMGDADDFGGLTPIDTVENFSGPRDADGDIVSPEGDVLDVLDLGQAFDFVEPDDLGGELLWDYDAAENVTRLLFRQDGADEGDESTVAQFSGDRGGEAMLIDLDSGADDNYLVFQFNDDTMVEPPQDEFV